MGIPLDHREALPAAEFLDRERIHALQGKPGGEGVLPSPGLLTSRRRMIETEVRFAQHEVLLEAARLVTTAEPIEIARQPRECAERTIKPKPKL